MSDEKNVQDSSDACPEGVHCLDYDCRLTHVGEGERRSNEAMLEEINEQRALVGNPPITSEELREHMNRDRCCRAFFGHEAGCPTLQVCKIAMWLRSLSGLQDPKQLADEIDQLATAEHAALVHFRGRALDKAPSETSDWERAYKFMSAFPEGTVFDQVMIASLIAEVRAEARTDYPTATDRAAADNRAATSDRAAATPDATASALSPEEIELCKPGI